MKAILCDVCGKIIEEDCRQKCKNAFYIFRMKPIGFFREAKADEMDICQDCFEWWNKQRKNAEYLEKRKGKSIFED